MTRPSYPSPLGVAIAVRVMVHPTEAPNPHQLDLRLLAEDGEEVGNAQITFGIDDPGDVRPGEEISVVFPVPLQGMPLPKPSAYSFEILIDGVHQGSIPFVAAIQAGAPDDAQG